MRTRRRSVHIFCRTTRPRGQNHLLIIIIVHAQCRLGILLYYTVFGVTGNSMSGEQTSGIKPLIVYYFTTRHNLFIISGE